jgi:GNAT superfamily N-acetyltransferase
MTDGSPSILLSPIDEERFGVRTASASVAGPDAIPQVLADCRSHAVAFLIARCAAQDLTAAQALERAGFRLMDTLVYYERNLAQTPLPAARPAAVRPYRDGEASAVQRAAAEAFRGYFGHYHADPRLNPAQCDAVYSSWAYRACTVPGVADAVLLAECDGALAGLLTVKVREASHGDVGLLGVVPGARRRGVASALLIAGMQWCLANGHALMTISTQVTNTASQRVWVRLGFEPSRAYYTFHKWFD